MKRTAGTILLYLVRHFKHQLVIFVDLSGGSNDLRHINRNNGNTIFLKQFFAVSHGLEPYWPGTDGTHTQPFQSPHHPAYPGESEHI